MWIKQNKVHGQFISSYRKSLKERDSAFKEYLKKDDTNSWNKFIEADKKVDRHFDAIRNNGTVSSHIKAVKEAGNRIDTKVTSEEIAKRRGRNLATIGMSSEEAKETYEKNKDKLPGKKTSVTDPLTRPLKDRMTPEKKEIIQNKLKRKAESQASIAKHAEQAKSLRKLRNIKRGAAGVAIGAGTLGVGYGVKKALEKKKTNK